MEKVIRKEKRLRENKRKKRRLRLLKEKIIKIIKMMIDNSANYKKDALIWILWIIIYML